MLSLAKRLHTYHPQCLLLRSAAQQLRWFRSDPGPPRRRRKPPAVATKRAEENSEWWIVDGEIHEIGDHVPPRERFVLPRDNVPNRRRKQLREQFMRRTRLVIKESEHEPWSKKYMELYQELRENWERLYWDEGYSKKHGEDHANYESAEDDDEDFSPYRSRSSNFERLKDRSFVSREGDTWEKVSLVRDKFEYDREKRMREKAFAPMHDGATSDPHNSNRNQPFDDRRYFPQDERN
ncbi:hypothetical protein PanWU01x14_044570 [Parasponia andersonii]|uniref:Uncharacterized protein n=1 Tax=Parasponia andersonii TaxID=3476 RepID=A0A2P5DP90_PARAD|nr:hypothetical protein PanWU01x14_044570 [Parasponia andersonii]